MRYEKLARQCKLAAAFHEHNPSAPPEVGEMHDIAVTTLREIVKPGSSGESHFSALQADQLCTLLNDACYLHGEIGVAEVLNDASSPVRAAALQRARWWVNNALACGRHLKKMITGCELGDRHQCELLQDAMIALRNVRKFVFQAPVPVDQRAAHSTEMDHAEQAAECTHRQASCERYLHALRSQDEVSLSESFLWAMAAQRWCEKPTWEGDGPATEEPDRVRRCLGDYVALRAAQLMKNRSDIGLFGDFALHMGEERSSTQLAPQLQRIKALARYETRWFMQLSPLL
jgi:hypothetical protein